LASREVSRAIEDRAGALVEQVDPIRVHALDQAEFPGALSSRSAISDVNWVPASAGMTS
jgi:hypothetical protein